MTRLAATVVVLPLALAATVLLAAHSGYWHPAVQRYQAGIAAHHAGVTTDCTASAWQRPMECTSNAEARGEPIYLVGDSNGDQFREAVDGAGVALARPVVGLTEDGCAYIRTRDSQSPRCTSYPARTAEFLASAPQGTVVIANSYLGWREGRLPQATSSASDALAGLGDDLTATVSELQQSGHRVVLVQPVPHWGDTKESLSWADCSVTDMVTDGCQRSMPLAEALDPAQRARDVVQRVAVTASTPLVDVSNEICPDGQCQTVAPDGMVRYRDATHISVPQSHALTDAFTSALVGTEHGVGR